MRFLMNLFMAIALAAVAHGETVSAPEASGQGQEANLDLPD